MKVRMSFKTPDAVDRALEDLEAEDRDGAREVLSKFVQYGEYITIEVDLETGTAEVSEV